MGKPIHTPGPLKARPHPESKVQRITLTEVNSPVAIAEIVPQTPKGYDATGEANARLLAAAYNAFDSAAKKLGVNAVELAERMHDEGLCELVWSLKDVAGRLRNTVILSKADEDAKVSDFAAIEKVEAILATVKGGAHEQ